MIGPRLATRFYCVLHHSQPGFIDMAKLRREQRKRGMLDVAVHYAINPDGTLLIGRPGGRAGNVIRHRNADTVYILLAQGDTEAQRETLGGVIEALQDVYPGIKEWRRAPPV